VFHRPLVLVSGLTVGDYLVWNWSLNGNHDVLALVSGLSLPPLAVACLWLLALSVARLIGRFTRRPGGESGLPDAGADQSQNRAGVPASTAPLQEASRPAGRSSGRIAA
jgi:hypothetical protein